MTNPLAQKDVSTFRGKEHEMWNEVVQTKDPLVLTNTGHADVVVMPIAFYQQEQEKMELLRMLAKGEEKIRQGIGANWETVKAEAEALLRK